MKKTLLLVLLVLLSACASVQKIESGDRTVGERFQITLEGDWNQVKAPNISPPNSETWTMEGLPIDQLLLYTGLKNGQAVHAVSPAQSNANPPPKTFEFRSTMQPDEIVGLFEGTFSRGGSVFKLVKLEPAAFAGGKGFRFEYAITRKVDNVQLSGVGYGLVDKGDLYAIVYQAPRMAFFARHQGRVEQIAKSARLKP